jgi:hypothetical protein
MCTYRYVFVCVNVVIVLELACMVIVLMQMFGEPAQSSGILGVI